MPGRDEGPCIPYGLLAAPSVSNMVGVGATGVLTTEPEDMVGALGYICRLSQVPIIYPM